MRTKTRNSVRAKKLEYIRLDAIPFYLVFFSENFRNRSRSMVVDPRLVSSKILWWQEQLLRKKRMMKSVSTSVTLCLERTQRELNHDPTRFLAIASVAIQDLPLLADELRTAIERNDTKLIKHMSHSMKGVASNFRAEPLMHLTEKLERECPSLTKSQIDDLFEKIADATQGTIAALANAITQMSQ